MQKIFAVLFVIFLIWNLAVYVKQWGSQHEDWNDSIAEAMKKKDTAEDILRAGISAVDAKLQSKVWLKDEFIDLNGLFQNVIGKDIVEDVDPTYDIYKMENGQLTFNYPSMDVSMALESMEKLKAYCDGRGTSLLYVQIPYKVNKYCNELPDGYRDGPNISADSFLEGLSEREIDYVDYRQVLHDQDVSDYTELFFDGDHHWKEETAFDAYVYLMNYWKEQYDYPVNMEYLDMENFQSETYEDSFLGSQIRRVGEWYADAVDDFTVIRPEFETSFVHEIYSKKGELREDKTKEGTFEEAVMSMGSVKNMDRAKSGRDNVYLGHNPCVDRIINNQVDEGSILILEDSFSRPVSAFMSLHFHEVYVMDLRYYTASLMEFLDEHEEIEYILISYAATDFKGSTYEQLFSFD